MRALRRHHRERVIAKRMRIIAAVRHSGWWPKKPGKLANSNIWLGCPDGRACSFCSRPYERAKEEREAQREWQAY